MKKATLQKAAVSSAAAVGILAFASPAAFAWNGNSSGDNNYESSYKQISSMRCYHMNNNYDSDWDGDWRQDCQPMMYGNSYYRMSSYNSNPHNNNCDRSNNHPYSASEASYNSYH